jgi:hypothetical protein
MITHDSHVAVVSRAAGRIPVAGWILVLLAGLGCVRNEVPRPPGSHPQDPAVPVVFQLDSPQTLVMPGGPVLVVMAAVSDSRCPKGVRCVQAGEGRITLALEGSGFGTYRLELSTTDSLPVYLNGLGCKLEGLEPYPRSGVAVEPTAYRATVHIFGAVIPEPEPES